MLIGEEASRTEGTRPCVAISGHVTSGLDADVSAARTSRNLARFFDPIRLAGYLGVLAIVVASLVPAEWRPSIGLAKEVEHGIAYCLVAAVLTIAGVARWPGILAIVVLAALLELGQLFVPGRDSNVTDFLGSAAGALLGFGLCSFGLGLMSHDRGGRARDQAAVYGAVRFKPIITSFTVGVLAVGVSMAVAHGTSGWLGAGLALAMTAIAVVDGQHFLIPDPLSAAGLALGLANSAVMGHGDLIPAMAGTVLRAAVLALAFFGLRLIYARLRGRHGVGLGDVKLAAVAGAWLDWSVMPIAVEVAALSALSFYVLRRYVLHHPLRSNSPLPFGLYFAPAIWIGWLLQTTLMRSW